MSKRKVVLVGAGNIARVHAAVLKETAGIELFGVFDPNATTAQSLAKAFGVQQVFKSIEDAARSGADAAHVLTPPDLHLATGLPFVEAGMAVLLEKPLGASSAECATLAEAAGRSGAVLGVNQNFAFNPAYRQLRACIEAGTLGRPRHVEYHYAVPLKQLAARMFGHWMFRQPVNILLEQAVHPLSQITDLAGRATDVRLHPEPPVEISPGVGLHASCQVTLTCERMPAYLRFQVGANFTVCRMTVVCDDGVAVADMFSNQFHTLQRTAIMEPVDNWLSARASAGQLAKAGWSGLRDYALSMVKLVPRADPFYLGMKGSIQAFHAALDAKQAPRIDAAFGAHLVAICEDMAKGFLPLAEATPEVGGAMPPANAGTVAVIGGTGFIGAHTVAALLAKGHAVRVMARGVRNLQPVFYRPGVTLVQGDVKRQADIARCVGDARWVVNLAHGGGGENFEAIRAAMVDSARAVVEVCLAQGVARLVHVGSISSLYLGPGTVPVTGATGPDPLSHARNDYSRAKALADADVLKANGPQLQTVVLRPGLVVGAGTSPFHSGLGFFNNDQFCVGWNDGNNPLPWVLAEDCASAIASALKAPAAAGHAYNLVGDVQPSARAYLADLARVTGRPLQFVPKSPTGLWLVEMGKWVIKRVGGRNVPRPYKRDILSRGLKAQFDCSDAKRDLGWQPVADADRFHQRALAVHAQP